MSIETDDLAVAVRKALYRRMVSQLRSALRGATDAQLLRAVEAQTATGSIAEILIGAPAEAGTLNDWAEELLRAAEHKREILDAAGGTYTTGQVARLLGRSVATIQQRLRRRTLLALPLAHGEWGFPVVQFTTDGVPSGLPRILQAFGDTDPWVQLSILLSADYGEGRIIDWIRENRRLAEAERIAGSYGQQSAA